MDSIKVNDSNCQAPRVRLVPDLSACAFKAKLTLPLCLWYRLRSLDTEGHGFLNIQVAIEGLAMVFGYTRARAYRQLNMGEGVFWDRLHSNGRTTIKIYGLKKVCEYFSTFLPNTARFYDIPADKFIGVKQSRLRLWESWHKPEGLVSHPISRDSIEDYTGVNRRQQKRYDTESEVKRTANFRPRCVQKRLPNSYHHKQYPGSRGMLARVRRELKSFKGEEAIGPRRYFATIKKLLHTGDRCDVCYTLIRNNKRQIKGRLEWNPIVAMPV